MIAPSTAAARIGIETRRAGFDSTTVASEITEGSDRFLLAELYSLHGDHPMWNRRVGVYLRPQGGTFGVVGIERESDPPDNVM